MDTSTSCDDNGNCFNDANPFALHGPVDTSTLPSGRCFNIDHHLEVYGPMCTPALPCDQWFNTFDTINVARHDGYSDAC